MIRPLVPVILLGGCFLFAGLGTTMASPRKIHPTREQPTASPTASPAMSSGTLAHLRLWKASDTQAGAELQIRLLFEGGAGGDGFKIPTKAERYQFGSYDDVPAGAGVVEITRAEQAPIRLGIHLLKDRYCTLLVRVHQGIPEAELLDDESSAGDDAIFRVFNLLSGGKGEVQVTLGDAISARLNASGGSLRAQGVKAAFYQISVNGTDNDGRPLRWNTETDLRATRRATLIICPDAYGRIRPRLIEDGPGVDAASEKTATTNTKG